MVDTNLEQAAQEFIDRKNRNSHPDGKFDGASRWYPSESEKQECCGHVRSPSRAYPYSYMVHCRTIQHVAKLYNVDEKELRKLVIKITPPKREGGDNYFKQVAQTTDNRLVSIFDGETEYKIGLILNGHARQDHEGGYYVYSSLESAKNAEFPKGSMAKNLPRKIIRVKAWGNYCRYGDKLSFNHIQPLEIIN